MFAGAAADRFGLARPAWPGRLDPCGLAPNPVADPVFRFRMQAMIPTFDVDLASPAATADHARRSAQIDALLQLCPATPAQ